MILDDFVDAVWVLRTLRGGMETQTVPAVIEFI